VSVFLLDQLFGSPCLFSPSLKHASGYTPPGNRVPPPLRSFNRFASLSRFFQTTKGSHLFARSSSQSVPRLVLWSSPSNECTPQCCFLFSLHRLIFFSGFDPPDISPPFVVSLIYTLLPQFSLSPKAFSKSFRTLPRMAMKPPLLDLDHSSTLMLPPFFLVEGVFYRWTHFSVTRGLAPSYSRVGI